MAWHAEFADETQIERHLQSGRELVGDRNAASWEGQHQNVGMARVLREAIG